MKLSVSILLAALVVASGQEAETFEGSIPRVRESVQGEDENLYNMIKNHHQRRMEKLEEMIEGRRQLKEDHESGRRRLDTAEYNQALKQFELFQKKLDHMKTHNEEHHHLNKLEDTKSLHDLDRRATLMLDLKDLK